ncbi:hypothetical protein BDZ97DRAFT_2027775 [Flammula alnicola]|nr:hypothetical protein BDZ97DRAFT_2027775 [Flammula alnicola]
MGLNQFLTTLFAGKDAVGKLTKTKRAYYLQSLTLVTACRSLPQSPELSPRQNHSLEEVFKKVEKALRLGTLNTEDKETDEITSKFREAHAALLIYIDTYQVKIKNVPGKKELDNAAQDDREAAKLLRDLESGLKARMESIVRMPKQALSISFWPEDPLQWDDGRRKFTYNSYLVEKPLKVEETTTLDMLIHRLLEYTALNSPMWKKFSLKQNPQLYLVFPSTEDIFHKEANHANERIPCLNPSITVKRFKEHTLHLIVNRQDASRRNVKLKDETEVELSPVCTNGWILTNCSDRIVVRVRSLHCSLYIHKVGKPFELPSFEFRMFTASSETLAEPISTTGSHLSLPIHTPHPRPYPQVPSSHASSTTLLPEEASTFVTVATGSQNSHDNRHGTISSNAPSPPMNLVPANSAPAFPSPQRGRPKNVPSPSPLPMHVPKAAGNQLPQRTNPAGPSNPPPPPPVGSRSKGSKQSAWNPFHTRAQTEMEMVTEDKKRHGGLRGWLERLAE